MSEAWTRKLIFSEEEISHWERTVERYEDVSGRASRSDERARTESRARRVTGRRAELEGR